MKSICIIIPFYNESNLQKNILQNKTLQQYRLILVNDGSDTEPDLSGTNTPFYLLTHKENLGQGAALQTGMEFAKLAGADIVVHFDADGQHNAEEIKELIKPIETGKASVVLGSRFLRKNEEKNQTRIPFVRLFVLKIARVIQFYFTGVWLSDSQNGFRAISVSVLPQIEIQQNRMAHAIEMIKILKQKKIKFVEVPVIIQYNNHLNKKGQKLSNGFFIVLKLFVEQVLHKKILFTFLVSLFSAFLLELSKGRNFSFFIFAAIFATVFLLVSFILWIFVHANRRVHNRTKQIRAVAISNAKEVNP